MTLEDITQNATLDKNSAIGFKSLFDAARIDYRAVQTAMATGLFKVSITRTWSPNGTNIPKASQQTITFYSPIKFI